MIRTISPLAEFRRRSARWLPVVLLVLAAGCQTVRESMGAMTGAKDKEYFRPANFNGEPQLPATLHRVLLLPVCGGDLVPPETSATLEEVFAVELQKQQRFEVVRLSRADCQRRFGAPEFSATTALPHDFLNTLGHDFDAEAVLFVDLTAYRAYRPLTLGVRAKLATVEPTRLLWTFDVIFSMDDPGVANSVRRFYHGTDASGVPLDTGRGALQSPGKFAAYVAAAMFNTLPAR